jgi:hypothetical protein
MERAHGASALLSCVMVIVARRRLEHESFDQAQRVEV